MRQAHVNNISTACLIRFYSTLTGLDSRAWNFQMRAVICSELHIKRRTGNCLQSWSHYWLLFEHIFMQTSRVYSELALTLPKELIPKLPFVNPSPTFPIQTFPGSLCQSDSRLCSIQNCIWLSSQSDLSVD